MSSTLCIRVTPEPEDSHWSFKQPVKGIFARRFYDHDGSLGGSLVTIGAKELPWLEGVLAAGSFEEHERKELEDIASVLQGGGSVDMWFKV